MNKIEKQISIMHEGKKHINFAMSKGTNSFPTGKKENKKNKNKKIYNYEKVKINPRSIHGSGNSNDVYRHRRA